MNGAQINFRSWLFRVMTWDMILPIITLLTPVLVQRLFPKNGTVLAIATMLVPIAAFFVRFSVGRRHIAANNVSSKLRSMQFIVLCIGILALTIADSFVILSYVKHDQMTFLTLMATYFGAMIFAMYPGREPAAEDRDYVDEATNA
jgi:hypothetical protein